MLDLPNTKIKPYSGSLDYNQQVTAIAFCHWACPTCPRRMGDILPYQCKWGKTWNRNAPAS